jgi:cystathionine gamma-lyase
MAAIAAVLGVTLKPGDTAVLPADSYYAVRRLAATWLEPMGINVRLAATRGTQALNELTGAKIVWLETPSNPLLDVADIRAVVAASRSQGITVVVDNTTATPYLQQPLALGATYVVASDTKAISGHSDLILGHVATTDGPEQVSYPGLPAHPGHAIARQQMRDFGSVVSFDLGTRARAESFLGALELVRQATSFGGVHSMAERRARWGGDAIGEGFIRFSVGCEATEDVLADVEQGLRRAG